MSVIKEMTTAPPPFTTDLKEVANLFRHTKAKSPGSDNICGQVLKTCADQLCGIFHHIFLPSLKLQRVPKLWEHAVIVPVAKSSSP